MEGAKKRKYQGVFRGICFFTYPSVSGTENFKPVLTYAITFET